MQKCGIYLITNLINKKVYVGSSIDIDDRWKFHKKALEGNFHTNCYLQRTYNKHSISIFEFKVLELLDDKKNLINKEQFFIDLYKSTNKKFGYNLVSYSQHKVLAKETIEKIRKKALSREYQSPAVVTFVCSGCRCDSHTPLRSYISRIKQNKNGDIFCNKDCADKYQIRGNGGTRELNIIHGTVNAYCYYKCRCNLCKETKKLAMRVYNDSRSRTRSLSKTPVLYTESGRLPRNVSASLTESTKK